MTGSYWPFYWSGLVLAVLPPQLFWWRRLRGSTIAGVAAALLVLAGIYLDHLSIIVAGLQRGHLATSAALYSPTPAEASLLAGTIGPFALMVLLSRPEERRVGKECVSTCRSR